MLILNEDLLIGGGAHRKVYRHPRESHLCIKVFADGFLKEQARELKAYRQLEKNPAAFEFIPRYHGESQTNLGIGSIFDLVQDDDGQVSRTLDYFFEAVERGEYALKDVLEPLQELKRFMISHHVVTTDLAARNICCRRKQGKIEKCLVIDDLGNTEFLPICDYSSYFARKKVRRKWRRFEQKLGHDLSVDLD